MSITCLYAPSRPLPEPSKKYSPPPRVMTAPELLTRAAPSSSGARFISILPVWLSYVQRQPWVVSMPVASSMPPSRISTFQDASSTLSASFWGLLSRPSTASSPQPHSS